MQNTDDRSPEKILAAGETSMNQRLASFEKLLKKSRTGTASVTLLDGIYVSYYNASTPLNQLATLQVPDPRSIVISPFDKTVLKDIEKAILVANIGLNPSSDGQVIRVNVPPLTKERRRELAKALRKSAETAKVAMRSIRQDLNKELKNLEKEKSISQDALKDWNIEVQKLTDSFTTQIDTKTDKKEQQILSL
ncbi:MAG: ribosome recycling factor [Proteobacteria bacterium]|nr:ribosome recycling factor [Pseudomonadota bacterium]